MECPYLLTEYLDELYNREHVSKPAAMQEEPIARSELLIPRMLSLMIFLVRIISAVRLGLTSSAVLVERPGGALTCDACHPWRQRPSSQRPSQDALSSLTGRHGGG